MKKQKLQRLRQLVLSYQHRKKKSLREQVKHLQPHGSRFGIRSTPYE